MISVIKSLMMQLMALRYLILKHSEKLPSKLSKIWKLPKKRPLTRNEKSHFFRIIVNQ